MPLVSGGLSGATATGRFVGFVSGGAPSSGSFLTGDYAFDVSTTAPTIWVCTASGNPGTWLHANQYLYNLLTAAQAGNTQVQQSADAAGNGLTAWNNAKSHWAGLWANGSTAELSNDSGQSMQLNASGDLIASGSSLTMSGNGLALPLENHSNWQFTGPSGLTTGADLSSFSVTNGGVYLVAATVCAANTGSGNGTITVTIRNATGGAGSAYLDMAPTLGGNSGIPVIFGPTIIVSTSTDLTLRVAVSAQSWNFPSTMQADQYVSQHFTAVRIG